jgi:Fic family protein
MTGIPPLTSLRPERFDRPDILKQLNAASRKLAELKGVAAAMPNQGILISTLGLQEAKDSSEIENIVTTHDELFREAVFPDTAGSAAAKEVAYYGQALRVGFDAVRKTGLLSNNDILRIQAELSATAPTSASCRARRSRVTGGAPSTPRRKIRKRFWR